MAQKQYHVTGMSCEHCVASVTEEVSEVPGVSEVVVDLAANTVTVHGTDLDDERLRAAIVEAGYVVADSVAA
ncbi:Copper chaperone CopZ [Streptomyces sp. 2224.1]|uniref:heavy-metal-associated domain-containing protein n=1 Tax=unclassified Streptomyces TaxID=2593676 RepID=UPI00089253B8|nr:MULTISPECIES: heavy-metal-associated domain-containing protein [unclassified Streptomyces]PBC80544.1 copper chaperone CopZ [Streptomyces sp. 2321.6]SDR58163.1 Copper chaperone CopZ [Streptomyces sp. KS_16]SEB78888.1 Copper chaperone CopZ [Streptomyces sp. 2133.1]SED45917.1 Copper chaperone CopZ [Streptomyces sp. 2224.1]SNC60953.1 Copper chaperone CopZ [Streptomyces sp. 2114.4]